MRATWLASVAVFAAWFAGPAASLAKEPAQTWELVNPEGVIRLEPLRVNPHPASLQGKTVLLRWNGKHNGDLFLARIGELLAGEVKGLKIIKSWEVAPETVDAITGSQEKSQQYMKKLAAFKPDMVIGAQAD